MKENSAKYQLKLSYISPSLWWKRSLAVNSKEWKDLRRIVLERADNTCCYCLVKARKYMIVDHISGDGSDNRLENLRVNCPMCDTIRHCGLAGINETLELRESKLSLLEIVEKTREYYLKYKRCPSAEEIDHNCQVVDGLALIDVAVKEGEEVPKERRIYKGFFTERFRFNFLDYYSVREIK